MSTRIQSICFDSVYRVTVEATGEAYEYEANTRLELPIGDGFGIIAAKTFVIYVTGHGMQPSGAAILAAQLVPKVFRINGSPLERYPHKTKYTKIVEVAKLSEVPVGACVYAAERAYDAEPFVAEPRAIGDK